mmetsp:Transcript_44981/g.104041  ORF Transcript_44981/g.104041 Transcript_44981/m.104041 type:complete len:106 (+) Transcript_44981:80-397(+)
MQLCLGDPQSDAQLDRKTCKSTGFRKGSASHLELVHYRAQRACWSRCVAPDSCRAVPGAVADMETRRRLQDLETTSTGFAGVAGGRSSDPGCDTSVAAAELSPSM